MMSAFAVLLWGGVALGVVAASLALWGRYRSLPSYLTGPNICQLEEKGCKVLFRTRNAALLGVPNSLLGLFFYAFVAIGLVAGWPSWILLSAGALAFAMTLYLAYVLLANGLECRICWAGHVANTVVMLSLAATAQWSA